MKPKMNTTRNKPILSKPIRLVILAVFLLILIPKDQKL